MSMLQDDPGPELRELLAFLTEASLPEMLGEAKRSAIAGHGGIVTYSRKVFIPLTQLCRDVCGYCTFAKPPRRGSRAFLWPEDVLAIAKAGQAAGCREALFTLGDKPELRYDSVRRELAELGHPTTLSYLRAACELVFRETGLFPHVNAGTMGDDDVAALRTVSISQGLMLETSSERLTERGQAHFGSPDKHPRARLATIAAAGRQRVPFTSGILIGIGETRQERLGSLLALRDLHAEFGHLQEIIVQNFRAKPGTRMMAVPDCDADELLWTIAAARLLFGPAANIQAPPNLSSDAFGRLLSAGINDWGGVSPVTPDHVNPEAPWPEIDRLRAVTVAEGFSLDERLAIYPSYAADADLWVDPALRTDVLRSIDASGFPRLDPWSPGLSGVKRPVASPLPALGHESSRLDPILGRALAGQRLHVTEIATLLEARAGGIRDICSAADESRRSANGDLVSYVVNRNINYTNICHYSCRFCAFSKGSTHDDLRGPAYDLDIEEVTRRAREAWDRGATEVCMQGGIHPHYTGETYLRLLTAVREAVPGLHVHAFSPLEVAQGATTLGLPVEKYLARLRDAGLGTLPGTAAEILDDEVRRILCPDKLTAAQWLSVVEAAHKVGLRTTATIMFGHLEGTPSWATHLLAIRDLQERTAGFTEFVPLPFVHMEAPVYFKGQARKGPTWRETVLMHAVSRLVLTPLISSIQASWVKLGPDGAAFLLGCGVNDLGGTLMNESISRAAGTEHGQELPPAEMESLIRGSGRIPRQRTTTYGDVSAERRSASLSARVLQPIVLTPPKRRKAAAVPSNTAIAAHHAPTAA